MDERVEKAYTLAVKAQHSRLGAQKLDDMAEAIRLLADHARGVNHEPELFVHIWMLGSNSGYVDNYVYVAIAPNKETAEELLGFTPDSYFDYCKYPIVPAPLVDRDGIVEQEQE